MPTLTIQQRKYLLGAAMLLSLLPLLFFSAPPALPLIRANALVWVLYAGSMLGLVGFWLLLWQLLLGIRSLWGRYLGDLFWVNRLHRYFGQYGVLLIFAHPAIMVYVYGWNLLLSRPELTNEFMVQVLKGRIALTLLLVIWLSSALFRKRLSYRAWKMLHTLAYVAVPIAWWHGLEIGFEIGAYPLLRNYWLLLGGVYLVLVALRLGQKFSLTGGYPYQLMNKSEITPRVTLYQFLPVGKALRSVGGQFAYLQIRPGGESHPFTISHSDEGSGLVSFSVRREGKFTEALTKLPEEAKVMLDGPYGVFTQNLPSQDELVLIAGGIGITPFMHLIMRCNPDSPRPHLFYSVKTESDIAYRKTIDAHLGNRAVYLLTQSMASRAQSNIESGRISREILDKHISRPLTDYHFLVCGPPGMVKAVKKMLFTAGVSKQQIDFEAFHI